MNIGRILKIAGRGAVKELPLGSLIIDVVELAVKTKVDRATVTGNDLETILNDLPATDRDNILQRTFDSDLTNFLTLEHAKNVLPKDTVMDKARLKLVMAVTVMICIFSTILAALAFNTYTQTGTIPEVETLSIILGAPLIALFLLFGLDSRALLSVLLSIQSRKVNKK